MGKIIDRIREREAKAALRAMVYWPVGLYRPQPAQVWPLVPNAHPEAIRYWRRNGWGRLTRNADPA